MNAPAKMIVHSLAQGSAEWHAHRARCYNASDAAAMMGLDPHRSRTDLLDEMVRGLSADPSSFQQRIFDGGHRREGACRPVAESIVADDLYPVTASRDVGLARPLGASFDGLRMARTHSWEHKQLNEELRAALPHAGAEAVARNDAQRLPKRFRVQMQQGFIVCPTVDGCLFSASDCDEVGNVTDSRHCWYAPDPELGAEILAGWKQFEADLATHQPKAAAPVLVAAPVQALPAVAVQVAGEIAIRHNFDAFEVALRDFLEHRLIRQPQSDQDFADLDVQIKAMKGAEAALESAEQNWIAQIEAVGSAKRTKDMLHKLVRDNRLMAEKLLGSEKERRKAEIVSNGQKALQAHIDALHARLGKPYLPAIHADFAGAVRGLKSIASMEDKVATVLANAKIEANRIADQIDTNLKALRELASDYRALFADAAALVLKAPDDCRAVITARIAEHKAEQERRAAELAERERARIRQEEADRLARERREREDREAEERREQQEAELEHQQAAGSDYATDEAAASTAAFAQSVANAPAPNVVPMRPAASLAPAAPKSPPTVSITALNEALGLNVTANLLEKVGFQAATIQGKAGKFYSPNDLPAICLALAAYLDQRAEFFKQQQAA